MGELAAHRQQLLLLAFVRRCLVNLSQLELEQVELTLACAVERLEIVKSLLALDHVRVRGSHRRPARLLLTAAEAVEDV